MHGLRLQASHLYHLPENLVPVPYTFDFYRFKGINFGLSDTWTRWNFGYIYRKDQDMNSSYLSSVVSQFSKYRTLGEKAIAQMQDEMLFWQYNSESNSVATIIKHMAGNMLSRWTDIFNTDGEKEWRNRDAEFLNDLNSRDELMALWNSGWELLFETLNSLQETDLERVIYIRNEAHTVIDAINRQLAHYSSHIGQIIYIGKMVCNEEWKSLSIPRNQSDAFNQEKFSKGKH